MQLSFQKKFGKKTKKGLTNIFRGCNMQDIKARASLSVSAQRRYFFTKKTFYIEKAKASFMLQELFLR